MKTRLLNPGPVNISTTVRQALLKEDICHREPEFSALQADIRRKLLAVYDLDADWAAILLTGSGTAAMEAMLSTLGHADKPLLILENGVYGERLARIADIHGIGHSLMQQPWGEPIDMGRLREMLARGVGLLALVQHETTTGRLNELEQVAALGDEYQVPLLVDAVSSFGAEEIRFDEWNITAAAATANKCLHGVPGISFVITRRKAIENLSANPSSLYLDLRNYLIPQDNGSTPFTQSVQVMYALDAALDEHARTGGWTARRSQYREKMQLVDTGLLKLGISPYLKQGASSSVLHAYHLPDGLSYIKLHDELRKRGFVIYAGQGKLAETVFRVSMMGDTSTADAEELVDAIADITSANHV